MPVSQTNEANNRMGLNLLYHLCEEKAIYGGVDRPVAVSPVAMKMALSILAGGAADDEKGKAFLQALGVGKPKELNALPLNIQECADTTSLTNSMFTDTSFQAHPAFADHLQGFSANINSQHAKLTDALQHINEWTLEQSKGMTTDIILKQECPTDDAYIVLLNALKFKGIWEDRFEKTNTKKTFFHRSESESGSSVMIIEMMFRHHEYILARETALYRAVCLPYVSASGSGSTSFVAYLPKPKQDIHQVIAAISPSQGALGFEYRKYDIFGFPKIELTHTTELFSTLQRLQFPIPTDYPKMGPGQNKLEYILHKTTFSTDEDGARAPKEPAVASAAFSEKNPDQLMFNRPFVFSIIHNDTGAILMVGVYTPHYAV